MSNRLIINPGTPQAWIIQLKPGVNRIGRSEDNDFVINHHSVSPHHCEITVTNSATTLRQLSSKNGTFVERVPVTEIQLHTGHHVQFGSVGMVFESVGLPPLPDAVNLPGDGAQIMVANPTPAPPPTPPMPPGMRINRPETASAHPPASSGATTKPAPPLPIRNYTVTTAVGAGSSLSDRQSLIRGSIGAVAGGLIGLLAWYALIKFTGYTFSLIAWGVGGLVGSGARMLAKNGSMRLGLVCALCALSAIAFGEYFSFKEYFFKEDVKSGIFMVLFVCLGVATAWKIGASDAAAD